MDREKTNTLPLKKIKVATKAQNAANLKSNKLIEYNKTLLSKLDEDIYCRGSQLIKNS